VIQRGETLGALADRHGTTVSLIMRSNQLSGNVIRVGDRLRIFQGTLRVWVDKSDNVLKVYLNDAFFLRYRVGTGQHSRTPAGAYRITLRQKHPTWYRPDGKEIPYGDPENLLGTHYLKLNTPGIGLHGTWEPHTIGSQSSAGCVRLLNEHIEELHDLLPVGTEVEIVE
jgi:lipoprotein-anchoring transpeptidase ErfK/SrfK